MNLRALLKMFFAVVACLPFVGCQKTITNQDLPGTYVAKKASQQKWIKGMNSCTIVLRADGNFVASVPDYMMATSDLGKGQVVSGKGPWVVEPHNPLAPLGIQLTFNQVNGETRNTTISHTLKAEGGKQGIELFFYVGEEGGDRFVFERSPNPPADK
jgi:hypothetical protein